MRLSSLLPDEWEHGWISAGNLIRHARKTSAFAMKQVVGFALPFAVGGWFAAARVVDLSHADSESLMRGLLTFVAIVTGFMVTLLLFTGKGEQTSVLSSEEMVTYGELARYLIFSQVLTLFVHILSAALIVAWFAVGSLSSLHWWLTLAAFGCFGVSITRTLLLPLQIFDLHDFALLAMVRAKRDAERKSHQEMVDKL